MQYPLQEVEQDHGHHSGLQGNSGAARNLTQKVEQDHGRHSGLPGNNGVVRNPSQEVEQDCDCCCVAPGSADPSVEVRLECLVISYPLEGSLKPGPSKSPDEVFL